MQFFLVLIVQQFNCFTFKLDELNSPSRSLIPGTQLSSVQTVRNPRLLTVEFIELHIIIALQYFISFNKLFSFRIPGSII